MLKNPMSAANAGISATPAQENPSRNTSTPPPKYSTAQLQRDDAVPPASYTAQKSRRYLPSSACAPSSQQSAYTCPASAPARKNRANSTSRSIDGSQAPNSIRCRTGRPRMFHHLPTSICTVDKV